MKLSDSKFGFFYLLLVGIFVLGLQSSCFFLKSDVSEYLGGVNGTVRWIGNNSFNQVIPAIKNSQDLNRFATGNSLFNKNWVVAPASTTGRDGLGPIFNARSCSGCHFRDGRGAPPYIKEDSLALLFRLSVFDELGVESTHPVYGEQFQPHGIPNVQEEGKVVSDYQETPGVFPDGEKYSLLKPTYTFTNLKYGRIGKVLVSPRIAPQVIGLGLLEAIPEKNILALADPDDKNKDGISGRPNYIKDIENGKKMLGRFGWKANQPSVKQQTAGAFNGDIGITSHLFPKDHSTDGQPTLKREPDGGTPELSERQLDRTTFYMQSIGVPKKRNNKDTRWGEDLFSEIKCASCHTPTQYSEEYDFVPELAHQRFHPFTDLLLHDMGDDLADNRQDGEATGREWRTPPLWGIGLIKKVNGHTSLLHDGRARNIEEAILWHGGEAERSRENYKRLNKKDRQALLEFLESL